MHSHNTRTPLYLYYNEKAKKEKKNKNSKILFNFIRVLCVFVPNQRRQLLCLREYKRSRLISIC